MKRRAEYEKIVPLLGKGLTDMEIARRVGSDYNYVSNVRRQCGVDPPFDPRATVGFSPKRGYRKIAVQMPDAVFNAARNEAAARGQSISSCICDMLARALKVRVREPA